MTQVTKEDEFDMTNSEQLVQRFVDQELSSDERLRFIARLGRDEGLRQRAIELEQLVLDVSRLPRAAMPDRFIDGVMERIALSEPAPSMWRTIADMFWAPRELQWNSRCVRNVRRRDASFDDGVGPEWFPDAHPSGAATLRRQPLPLVVPPASGPLHCAWQLSNARRQSRDRHSYENPPQLLLSDPLPDPCTERVTNLVHEVQT
jgi:hypothetical protein